VALHLVARVGTHDATNSFKAYSRDFIQQVGIESDAGFEMGIEMVAKARRLKHLFGGAMRQAGIVAAAGVYALDHHVGLLADDHARARRLAEGWHAAGLPVDLGRVETNFVQLDVEPLGMSKWDVIAALKEAGVGVSNTVHPATLRAVTHLDVSDEDIEAAIALAPEALAARV